MRLLFNTNIEVGNKIYVSILLKLWHFCLRSNKISDNYIAFILFYVLSYIFIHYIVL